MRIVFLSAVGIVGGAERCLLTLIDALRRVDPSVECHVVCCGEGPLAARVSELGATAHLFPMPKVMAGFGESGLKSSGKFGRLLNAARGATRAGPATLRYAKELGVLVRSLRPDLVHSNGMKTHLLSRLINKAQFTRENKELRPHYFPMLWHVHDFVGARPLMARGLRLASGRCDGCIAISDSVAKDIARVLPGVAISTVMNATDIDRFSPGAGDGNQLDELAGLEPVSAWSVRVGLVATYARWKGQDVFIDGAARVAKEHPWVRFYIIGGPVYATAGSQFSQAELSELAQRHGVTIGFIAFQADPTDVYRSLDVVVHASTQPEPFGLTIIEAMSCGKPVVVSAAGGAQELFVEGVDGLGYTPGNADEMAAAVSRLCSDAALRDQIGAAARATAVARFASDVYAQNMLSVYRKATARPVSD